MGNRLSELRRLEERYRNMEEQIERYKLGREVLRQKNRYRVTVVGTGSVARAIVSDLSHDPRMGLHEFDLSLDRLVVVSRDRRRAETLAEESQGGGIRTVEGYGWDQLERALEEVDVAIVSTDTERGRDYKQFLSLPEEERRGHMLRLGIANAPLIQELGREWPDSYTGAAMMVTTHPDLLSYVFAAETGLPVERVWGCNHSDSLRIREAITETLDLELVDECFPGIGTGKSAAFALAIGTHDENLQVPIELALVGELPAARLFYRESEKLAALTRKKLVEDIQEDRIPHRTAQSVRAVLEAAITGLEPVSVASWCDFSSLPGAPDGLDPLYIGQPRFFSDLSAIPVPYWGSEDERGEWLALFDRLPEETRDRFFESARQLGVVLGGMQEEGRSGSIPKQKALVVDRVDVQAPHVQERVKRRRDYTEPATSTLMISQKPTEAILYRFRGRKPLITLSGNNIVAASSDGYHLAVVEDCSTTSLRGRKERYRVLSSAGEEKETYQQLTGALTMYGGKVYAGSVNGVVEWFPERLWETDEPIDAVVFAGGMMFGAGSKGIYCWKGDERELVYGKGRSFARLEHTGKLILGLSANGSCVYHLDHPQVEHDLESVHGRAAMGEWEGDILLATVEQRGGDYVVHVKRASEELLMQGRYKAEVVLPQGDHLPRYLFFDQGYLFAEHGDGIFVSNQRTAGSDMIPVYFPVPSLGSVTFVGGVD